MRIAIFHLGFFYSGGGEKLVLEEARGLRKLGHKVTVFAPVVDRKHCFPDLIGKVKVKALLPQLPNWLPFKDGILIITSCLLFPLMLGRFRKFDLFLGANQPGVYFAWLVAKLFKKPHFAYLAQPNRLLYQRPIDLEQKIRIKEKDYLILLLIKKIFGRVVSWIDRSSIEGAEAVFANGEFAAKNLKKVYRIEPIICPAGCYPRSLKKLNFPKKFKGDLKINQLIVKKPFILLTNRHYPQKRFEYAISSLPFVLKDNDLRLVITGESTKYTQYLKILVRQLKLEEKVLFLGLVSEKDLEKLYSQAAVYVYTSPEEDFGMGIIEAMARATPVVAWNQGGPTVTVKDGQTGFLARPYDITDYSQKIARLLSDRKLNKKMGTRALRRAQKYFSYNHHNQILEKTLILVGKNCDKI